MSKFDKLDLTDQQIMELAKPATYDGIAIAEEMAEFSLIVLRSRPNDLEIRERLRTTVQNAIVIFKPLNRGNEIIKALRPLIDELGLEI